MWGLHLIGSSLSAFTVGILFVSADVEVATVIRALISELALMLEVSVAVREIYRLMEA